METLNMPVTRDPSSRGLRGALSGALFACFLLPACGVDVGDPVSGGGGGDDEIPEQVVLAFERSCVPGCHDSATLNGNLSLERGALPGVLDANSMLDSTVRMVKIGDLEGSMIALKVMDSETLALYGGDRPGAQMPLADLGGPQASIEDANTIIAWIAGAKFPALDADDTGDGGETGAFEDWDDW